MEQQESNQGEHWALRGFTPRFFTVKKEEKTSWAPSFTLGSYTLREPRFFKADRLATLAKTSPKRKSRVRAVRMLLAMYEEGLRFLNYQFDTALDVSQHNTRGDAFPVIICSEPHSPRPDKDPSKETARSTIDFEDWVDKVADEQFGKDPSKSEFIVARKGVIDEPWLERDWCPNIMRNLEDIMLFGNYEDARHAAISGMPINERGINALRRAHIDSDFKRTRRFALSQLARIMHRYDNNDPELRQVDALAGRIETIRDVYQSMLDLQMMNSLCSSHQKYDRKDTRRYLKRFSSNAMKELRRGGRHATKTEIGLRCVDELLKNEDSEGLASIIMRSEQRKVRIHAFEKLKSKAHGRWRTDEEMNALILDQTLCVPGDSSAKHWMMYAAIRCTDARTVQYMLDDLINRHEIHEIADLASYSKLRSIRRKAIEFLRTCDFPDLAFGVCMESNYRDSAEAAMSIMMGEAQKGEDEMKGLRIALKRPSPFIGNRLLSYANEQLKRRTAGIAHPPDPLRNEGQA